MQGATDPGSPLPVRGGLEDMEKPVQWMTLQELQDELERTRPAWEAGLDPDGVLAEGPHPALGEDAHQLVANELLRRPSNG